MAYSLLPSTFDEDTAKSLIGQELEGTVEKVPCEPYEITNEETGEVLELSHRWVFLKPGDRIPAASRVEQHEEAAVV